jgi:nitroimidazol reductase NimA-like FMN-containing flavoprotein (pyridoxamine 5'-phosphate oxidase superfamily)
MANGPSDADLKAKILKILDEHRVMTVATVRPDGWPQATLVGYVYDDLALYFVVSVASQKLENIRRDPRVSIAIGHESSGPPRGLSMAARVHEVNDLEEIRALNLLIANRYPEVALFSPSTVSTAVLRAMPTLVSIVDQTGDAGAPDLVSVHQETSVRRVAQTDQPDF